VDVEQRRKDTVCACDVGFENVIDMAADQSTVEHSVERIFMLELLGNPTEQCK